MRARSLSAPALTLVALAAALAAGPALGAAAPGPEMTLIVDGIATTVAGTPFLRDGKELSGVAIPVPAGLGAAGFGSAEMNPDPWIIASASLIDLASPSVFELHVVTPIVPTTGPVMLRLAIGATCTDSDGGGCAGLPVFASGFLGEGSLDGVSEVFGGGAFSGPAGGSGGFGTTEFFASLPAVTTYGLLDLHVGLAGSGGGDAYGLSMRVDLLRVPEPASGLLAALALLGGGLARRRPCAGGRARPPG